jgi:hypothetical protein
VLAAVLLVARSSVSRVRQVLLVRGPANAASLEEIDNSLDTRTKIIVAVARHSIGASSHGRDVVGLDMLRNISIKKLTMKLSKSTVPGMGG